MSNLDGSNSANNDKKESEKSLPSDLISQGGCSFEWLIFLPITLVGYVCFILSVWRLPEELSPEKLAENRGIAAQVVQNDDGLRMVEVFMGREKYLVPAGLIKYAQHTDVLDPKIVAQKWGVFARHR